MKNRHVPEIRFAEFSGDWEERKLEKVAEFNPKTNLPEQFEYVDLESVVGIHLISHRTEQRETAPSRAQRLAKQGDVFFQTVRPYQKNNYLFDLSFDNYVFSTGYAQMRPYLDSYFLLSRLQEDRFVSNVLDRSTGTSYPAINSNDLAQIEISVPTLKEEQAKIGNFFKQLDNTIALYQQELTTLKQTKQGFLQKMFPKEGESVPEVRFAGFTGDWKESKLESVYGKIRNAFVGTATPYYVEDGHFYLESNNVKDGQINRNTEVFINDEFYEKQKDNWLHTGDLVMVQSGHVGHTAVIPEELDNTAAHALIIFSNYREKTDPYFLNYQLQTQKSKKRLGKITTGNTIKHILASEMKKFLVDIPKYEEQKIIGNFFKLIDNTIALHQRELEALKETKKAFLQKMFA